MAIIKIHFFIGGFMSHLVLRKFFLVCISTMLLMPVFAFAINDSIQDVPAMGWNSWNYYGCNISQATILTAANAMVKKSTTANWEGEYISMADVGYKFVNLDDCWEGARTNGTLTYSASLFPKGFVWMCDSIRKMGLIPGLYTSAGTATCQGKASQYSYDSSDAMQYAKWGFQYLKEDWCNVPSSYQNKDSAIVLYKRSYKALRKAADTAFAEGRYSDATKPKYFTFSLCNWGSYNSWTYGAQCGHSARMSGDISATWTQVVNIIDQCTSNGVVAYNTKGFFNDPDMLEVGNGLTAAEDQSHFDLWCQMQSPLLTGNNLGNMSTTTFNILTNREVIAIDQDSLNWGGRRVRVPTTNVELWYKRCFTRSSAGVIVTDSTKMKKSVIVFNKSSSSITYSILRSDPIELGTSEAYQVRNLWTHAPIDTLQTSETSISSVTVAAHGTVHLLLTPMMLYTGVISDGDIEKVSNTQLAGVIKARRGTNGMEIYIPMSANVAIFDVQGRQIASFVTISGKQWYQVQCNFKVGNALIVKALVQNRVLTKTLVLSR
jgi:alpha-galactosidase